MDSDIVVKNGSRAEVVLGFAFFAFVPVMLYVVVVSRSSVFWFLFLIAGPLAILNGIMLYTNGTRRTIRIGVKGISLVEYRMVSLRIRPATIVEFAWEEVQEVQVYTNSQGTEGDVKSLKILGPSFLRKRTGHGPLATIKIPGNIKELPKIMEFLHQQVPTFMK